MFNTNNYIMISETMLRVHGTEFSVEDISNGKIYLTTKDYINKLFEEMGYRNLNVIKILEEFAGKFITDIGALKKSKIFVSESESSFLITNPESFMTLVNLENTLVAQGFKKISENSASCLDDKEFLIQSPKGICFSIRVNLDEEKIEVLSLHINESGITDGVMYEGEYKLTDYDVVNSIMVTLNSDVDASALVRPDEIVSLYEYIELLKNLGLAKLNRRTNIVHMTDEGLAVSETALGEDIESSIGDYNAHSWLKRHIVSSGKTFGDCIIFASNFPEVSPWRVHEFYSGNIRETNDFALLK